MARTKTLTERQRSIPVPPFPAPCPKDLPKKCGRGVETRPQSLLGCFRVGEGCPRGKRTNVATFIILPPATYNSAKALSALLHANPFPFYHLERVPGLQLLVLLVPSTRPVDHHPFHLLGPAHAERYRQLRL